MTSILVAAVSFAVPALRTKETPPTHGSVLRIDVTAVVTAAAEPTVTFTLTNRSSAPFDAYTRDLPWGSVKSLTLAAVEASYPATIVAREPRLELSIPQVVRIEAGQSLQGEVQLRSFFTKLHEHLVEDDVLILWSFRLKTRDGEESNRVVGVLEIPRKSNRA